MTFWNESLIFKCPALSILDRLCNNVQQVVLSWFKATASKCVMNGNKRVEEVVRNWSDQNVRMREWRVEVPLNTDFSQPSAGYRFDMLLRHRTFCHTDNSNCLKIVFRSSKDNCFTVLIVYQLFVMHKLPNSPIWDSLCEAASSKSTFVGSNLSIRHGSYVDPCMVNLK